MIPGLNPWLLIGAALAILASFIGGMTAGKKMERATWLEREVELQAAANQETARANQIAMIYGQSLSASQDTAFKLQRKLNEQREQLAACLPGGGVSFTPAFVRLYNDALQADAGHSSKPDGEANGAGPIELAAVSIENGRRWKDCRSQLNALIDILEPAK